MRWWAAGKFIPDIYGFSGFACSCIFSHGLIGILNSIIVSVCCTYLELSKDHFGASQDSKWGPATECLH